MRKQGRAGQSQRQQRPLCVLRFASPEEQAALDALDEYWEARNAGEPLIEELPSDATAAASGGEAPAAQAGAAGQQAKQPSPAAAAHGQCQAGEGEDSEWEEEEEAEQEQRLKAARAAAARGDPPPLPPPRYCEERMLVVTEEFADMCWCELPVGLAGGRAECWECWGSVGPSACRAHVPAAVEAPKTRTGPQEVASPCCGARFSHALHRTILHSVGGRPFWEPSLLAFPEP